MLINAYYNGLFTSRENIKISLNDRAVFFGDGIYDAAIGRHGKIFMLDEHIERFFANARLLDLRVEFTKSELTEILLSLAENATDECFFVYFQLSRSSDERAHSYPDNAGSNLLVTINDIPFPDVKKRVRLTLADDIRYEMCHVKTLNLLPAVLASRKATALGKDETIFHRNGTVTECAHSNVHIITDSVLLTHPKDKYILPGISRGHMLKVCKRLGIPVIEREFSVYELFKADEVLITSSSKLALLASSVDSVSFPYKENGIGRKICDEMLKNFVSFTENDTSDC